MKELQVVDMRVVPGDSAYLIYNDTTAILYDNGFAFTGYALARKIKETLGERKLDYIFLTHSHCVTFHFKTKDVRHRVFARASSWFD